MKYPAFLRNFQTAHCKRRSTDLTFLELPNFDGKLLEHIPKLLFFYISSPGGGGDFSTFRTGFCQAIFSTPPNNPIAFLKDSK